MNFTSPSSIILKTTSGCNAACTYCYEENAFPGEKIEVIPLEVIEQIFDWAANIGLSKVQLVWHGNEPLLAGKKFFSEMFSLSDRYKSDDLEYMHSLQTNGIGVDDSWIELFKEHNIGIGLSLDGPAWLHDLQRQDCQGRPSHQKVEKSLYQMIDAGISVGLSCVITRNSLKAPREIIRYFNAFNVSLVDFLPMSIFSESLKNHPLLITPKEFADFMGEILDEWLYKLQDQIVVRYFENIIVGLSGGNPTLCKFSGRCGAYISVDYDGSVYPCDAFMGWKDLKMGNLRQESLGDILCREKYLRFREAVNKIPMACHGCKWVVICHGGCPAERYAKYGSFDSAYPLCIVRRQLNDKLEHYLTNLVTELF